MNRINWLAASTTYRIHDALVQLFRRHYARWLSGVVAIP